MNRKTSLHRAAWKGDAESVRALIDTDADVHPKDDGGRTPLHQAAGAGNAEVIRLGHLMTNLCRFSANLLSFYNVFASCWKPVEAPPPLAPAIRCLSPLPFRQGGDPARLCPPYSSSPECVSTAEYGIGTPFDRVGVFPFNQPAPVMTIRATAIFRSPLLILIPVLFFGTACNRTDSGKDAPTRQEVHVISGTKADEDSRIKQRFHGLIDRLESFGESIAEVIGQADADTTLLHLQDGTVAVQVVPLDITQRQEAEEKIAFVSGVSAGAIGTVVSDRANEFDKLSAPLRKKLKTAGLSNRVPHRTNSEAKQLYRQSVPRIIRDMGEDAVWEFLACQGGKGCTTDGKHLSHIVSYGNDKDRVKNPKNVMWEHQEKNSSRGENNMTRKEVLRVKWENSKDVANIIKKRGFLSVKWGQYATFGGVTGMIVEAPVAGAENYFHWKHGAKSLRQAINDTAKNTAISTGMGIVSSVGFVLLSPAIGPSVMVPLAIVGGVVYISTTVYRIVHAANPDLDWGESLSRLYNTALQKKELLGEKIGDQEWLPILSRNYNVSTR